MPNKKKRALITGITGQDGAYLADFLLKKGYSVYGFYRRVSTPNFWRLQYLNIFEKIHLIPGELLDMSSIIEAIKISKPSEIYNLAAQSYVGASFEQPTASGQITGLAVTNILEAIRLLNPHIKFYQASTSELYGSGNSNLLDENSTFKPASPYAAAKLYAYWITKIYRDGYNISAFNGILFNHESPLRGLEFVTRKITNTVAKIYLGIEKKLHIGNIKAKRDWGYAPEFVESMWLMLQQKKADDYVIATGETHTVEEFIKAAFTSVKLDWKKYTIIDKKFFRPKEVEYLRGNPKKAKKNLNWEPKVKFHELVQIMMDEDLSRWKKMLDGKHFPWDAANYPNEKTIISRRYKLDR